MALKPKRHLTGVSRPSRFPTNDPVLRASEGEPMPSARSAKHTDAEHDVLPRGSGRSGGAEAHVFPPVLNEAQTAALLGVSPRTLLKLRGEPWFPLPLQLGPRATRWLRDELLEALATRAPRGGIQPKPLNLIGRETR
jgi:predicted DNA-binding transcriptional regulator AlpA